jgi:hypothetical protein
MKPWDPVAWRNILCGGIVLAVYAVLIGTSRLPAAPVAGETDAAGRQQAHDLRLLLKRAGEWTAASRASEPSPPSAVFAAYAVAYVNAAREVAGSDARLAKLTGQPLAAVAELTDATRSQQMVALKEMH